MEMVHALTPAIILLMVGILAIALARPARLSPIVGYLFAGVLIGPYGFDLIAESETTHLLAELGIVFLLFDIGLHFSLAHLWEARRDILGLGPLQIILSTGCLAALASLFGFEWSFAIAIGATLALSSTAVAIQTLAEHGQQQCPIGVTATAVLIFQDICAIFLLILASSLETSESSIASAMAVAALNAAVAFASTILLGRFLIRPLFKLLLKSRNEEIFTAAALLIVLATAAATGIMGLSLTLGAFLGGMIISETPLRYVIRTEVKPFRGLLLGFFFITVGMSLDTNILFREWALVLAFSVLLIGIKTLLVFISALVLRMSIASAIQLGFLLSQGSEFAFVIFGMPALRSTLGPDLSAISITAVAVSMALTPPLALLGHRIATRLVAAQQGVETARATQVAPIVIVGMGEVGRYVSDALEAHGIPYTAIEMDNERFIEANASGYPVAFGDATDLRLMEMFQISQRSTIVITIPRYEVARGLSPVIRERYPNLTRFVAVENDEEGAKLGALGMQAIVSRSIPEGLDLAAAVLKEHKVSDEKIHEWMRRQQSDAIEAMGANEDLFQTA